MLRSTIPKNGGETNSGTAGTIVVSYLDGCYRIFPVRSFIAGTPLGSVLSMATAPAPATVAANGAVEAGAMVDFPVDPVVRHARLRCSVPIPHCPPAAKSLSPVCSDLRWPACLSSKM